MTHSKENERSIIVLNELKNESVNKALFFGIARWLKGATIGNVELKGTHRQIDAVQNVMVASKMFQEELSRPTATINSVSEKLDLKHAAANSFKKVFGTPWLL
jgi:hypothetical protein